ncbi:hypothetical protein [Lichenicoccus sp.]|uniref:hypothetical protein n=1 Tax=Lichenicoccus sp. TaxID=2781899 RepID=UPI003D1370ED
MSPWLRAAPCALLVLGGNATAPCRSLAAGVAPGPEATSQDMASAPLRYGGDLDGPLQGRLLLALQAPDANGRLQGHALLWSAAGETGTSGTVAGLIRSGHVPGGAACTLDLSLAGDHASGQVLILDGLCSPSTLSGAIRTHGPRPGWLARQIFWWDSGDTGGRYWLTRTGSIDSRGIASRCHVTDKAALSNDKMNLIDRIRLLGPVEEEC